MSSVRFEQVTHLYSGAEKPSVQNLELQIEDKEFVVLVGPSGCGKSTSLRMLAGLEDVERARSRIGDRNVTAVPPKNRDIAMVFQNYALYPHMSVADNMGFALKMAGVATSERASQVAAAANCWPERLSRPQTQRVVRRATPARRDGPGHRPRTAGLPHGRAAVQPRREASGVRPVPRSRRCNGGSGSPPSTSPTTRSKP